MDHSKESVARAVKGSRESNKKAEEELKKSRERLAKQVKISSKQNLKLIKLVKEKAALQRKLEQYAKKLELKVRSLEKDRIKLTKKEKLVLYGICAYPLLTDLELAEKLKIKRSTLTSIKNRLKEDGWFRIVNIPNFYALGCELFSVICCDFNTPLKERKELGLIDELMEYPELVFNHQTDKEAIGVFVSKKITELKKFLDSCTSKKQEILKKEIEPLNFFYELNTIEKLDFSSLLNNLFELELKLPKGQYRQSGSQNELNHNEKRVLYALVEFPEANIREIAKKIWLSKPTVSKIKKKLLKEGFLKTLVIPAIDKLSLNLFSLVSFKFDHSLMQKVQMLENQRRKKEEQENTFAKTITDQEIILLMFFRNMEENHKKINALADFYEKNNLPFEKVIINYPISKTHFFMKMDFASLTKKLLFE